MEIDAARFSRQSRPKGRFVIRHRGLDVPLDGYAIREQMGRFTLSRICLFLINCRGRLENKWVCGST